MTYESAFVGVACDALGPLCNRFGLLMKHSGYLDVRFESKKVRLVVAQRHAWDRIEFAIGLVSDRESYELDSIAAWKGVEDVPMQVGEENVLRRVLVRAALLLTESAPSLLAGQESEFAQLASFCALRNEEYGKRIRVDPILSSAHEAWAQRRYGDVVSLLSSVIEDLGQVEKMRLRLAAKYLEREEPQP